MDYDDVEVLLSDGIANTGLLDKFKLCAIVARPDFFDGLIAQYETVVCIYTHIHSLTQHTVLILPFRLHEML